MERSPRDLVACAHHIRRSLASGPLTLRRRSTRYVASLAERYDTQPVWRSDFRDGTLPSTGRQDERIVVRRPTPPRTTSRRRRSAQPTERERQNGPSRAATIYPVPVLHVGREVTCPSSNGSNGRTGIHSSERADRIALDSGSTPPDRQTFLRYRRCKELPTRIPNVPLPNLLVKNNLTGSKQLRPGHGSNRSSIAKRGSVAHHRPSESGRTHRSGELTAAGSGGPPPYTHPRLANM